MIFNHVFTYKLGDTWLKTVFIQFSSLLSWPLLKPACHQQQTLSNAQGRWPFYTINWQCLPFFTTNMPFLSHCSIQEGVTTTWPSLERAIIPSSPPLSPSLSLTCRHSTLPTWEMRSLKSHPSRSTRTRRSACPISASSRMVALLGVSPATLWSGAMTPRLPPPSSITPRRVWTTLVLGWWASRVVARCWGPVWAWWALGWLYKEVLCTPHLICGQV